MSTRWERLAGDTGAFALKLAFARDPDDGQAADPDVGLSWGGFQIWVEGRNLCAHREAGARIESAHWYLLPLHEEHLPARNLGDTAWASLRATRFPPAAIENDERQARGWDEAWQAWWMRHALRAASHGGLFPDVVVRRLRDHVEVSWGQTRTAGMPRSTSASQSPLPASADCRRRRSPIRFTRCSPTRASTCCHAIRGRLASGSCASASRPCARRDMNRARTTDSS